MITLKIGNEQRKNDDIKERWIAQQIRKRQKDDQPICVKAIINEGDVNVSFSTAACTSTGGGGGRAPNRKERKLLELWKNKGLKKEDINAGMIISFLNQYDKYL